MEIIGLVYVYFPFLQVGENEDDEMASLMSAAISFSQDSGAYEGGVSMWGPHSVIGMWPPGNASLESSGVVIEEKLRTTSIPMIAPLDPKVQPKDWYAFLSEE